MSHERKPRDVPSVTLRSCGAGVLTLSLAGGLVVAGGASWHALLSPHQPLVTLLFAPPIALCGAAVVLLLCLEAVPKVALVLALAHVVSKKTGRAAFGYASLYASGLAMLMASVALARFSVWPAVAEHADAGLEAFPGIAVGVIFASLLGASFAFGETRAALSLVERGEDDSSVYPSIRFDRGEPRA